MARPSKTMVNAIEEECEDWKATETDLGELLMQEATMTRSSNLMPKTKVKRGSTHSKSPSPNNSP